MTKLLESFQVTNPTQHEVTHLLAEWSGGDESTLSELIPLVEELRRLAHHYMSRERAGHALQTTALINEAYLRLAYGRQTHFKNRGRGITAFNKGKAAS